MTTRLGAVAFTVLWCEVIYPYVVYPMHCHARLGEQYNCESIQVTINCDTWRCQRACHQFLLNAPRDAAVEGRLTVASAADSRLVDPRAGCNRAYITTLVCNRHLLMVDLPHATRDAGQQYLEFHFTFVRVYYLTTVEGKEFLPGSSLSNLDFGSRFKDFAWFRIGALWLYYPSGTPTLRSTRTWVNQLLTRVHY